MQRQTYNLYKKSWWKNKLQIIFLIQHVPQMFYKVERDIVWAGSLWLVQRFVFVASHALFVPLCKTCAQASFARLALMLLTWCTINTRGEKNCWFFPIFTAMVVVEMMGIFLRLL